MNGPAERKTFMFFSVSSWVIVNISNIKIFRETDKLLFGGFYPIIFLEYPIDF